MTKHFVEFHYPGTFVAETAVVEITSRDADFNIPKTCFGFVFFDREYVTVDGEQLSGSRKNESNFWYFGTVYTLHQLEVLNTNSKYDVLLSNMKCNKWPRVVRTRCGNFQPLEAGDVVLNIPRNVEEMFYQIDMYERYKQ